MAREDHDVTAIVRAEVIERDRQRCRVCGQFVAQPALHHVTYRAHGGSNDPSNLVVIGWLPGHDCHLTLAHGPDARLFRELLTTCIDTPGVTALQLKRWRERRLRLR